MPETTPRFVRYFSQRYEGPTKGNSANLPATTYLFSDAVPPGVQWHLKQITLVNRETATLPLFCVLFNGSDYYPLLPKQSLAATCGVTQLLDMVLVEGDQIAISNDTSGLVKQAGFLIFGEVWELPARTP